MARAPVMAPPAMASTPPPPAGGGGDPGADPSGGADPGADAGGGGTVLVTITDNGDGTYTVYAGSPPDAGDDMSADDADAMGGGAGGAPPAAGGGGGMGGGAGGSGGKPAGSIGEALKAAMDILQDAASSAGAPGSADDQLAAGFVADKAPKPASGPAMKNKY